MMFLVCVGDLAPAAATAASGTPVRPNAQILSPASPQEEFCFLSPASPQEDGQRTLIKRPPCISRMMGKSSSMARFALSFLCARVHVFMRMCVMRFLRWCSR